METEDVGGLPASSISDLLSDLAGHHERLEQVNRDLGEALAAAQASADQVKELLQEQGVSSQSETDAVENELEVTDDDNQFKVDQVAPRGFEVANGFEVAEVEDDEFAVPSEWHCKVLEAVNGGSAAKGLETAEITKLVEASEVKVVYTDEQEMPAIRSEGSDIHEFPVPRLSQMSSQASQESWDPAMNIVFHPAITRVQERLGKHSIRGCVTAEEVYNAIRAMGVRMYTVDDIGRWLMEVNRVYMDNRGKQRSSSASMGSLRSSVGLADVMELPSLGEEDEALGISGQTMRFKVFVQALLDDQVLSHLGTDLKRMSELIREVLFSGWSNRIVAEITRIRIEEVAGPMEAPDLLTRMEPVTAFVIVLNGIYIGIQTSAEARNLGDAWFWGNVSFNIFMAFEILAKFWAAGCRHFMRGMDRWWNLFDCLMVFFAIVDIVMEVMWQGGDIVPISVMRIIRLTRLTKLIRLFRLRFMKELNLMVRGLIGGLQTLFWAITLLFFTLYVIAIMVTTMFGSDVEMAPELVADELFSSVPRAILTSFRCFMGDCATSGGRPIIKLASDAYGLPFILGYFVSTVFVVFGLFNLIVAVYVENTMHAARTEGKKDPEEMHRDNVRVAKQTRQLLKKFCAADRLWSSATGKVRKGEMSKAMRASMIDDVVELSMQVSKEMYLTVIQDASVQKIMDDIDIPPERDHLFDVLDADCSGGLEVTELITGLLRVRGESRKSDAVGTLLAVRAVQDLIRDQEEHVSRMEKFLHHMRDPEPQSRRTLGSTKAQETLRKNNTMQLSTMIRREASKETSRRFQESRASSKSPPATAR